MSLSCLGTGGTVASDGTDDYSYTPSGTVTAAGTPGGTAFTTMTDQHGDVVGTFSPTSTAEGLAGYSSYSPYGAETATNFGENLGYQGGRLHRSGDGAGVHERPLVQPGDRFVCLR